MDIEAWLADLGLVAYGAAFRDNAIDATLLSELDDGDLKELGVAALGHRKKILSAIASLEADGGEGGREGDGPDPQTAVVSAADGERRQVTVLFADLSNYTGLSNELDPEQLHDLLNDYFAVVDGVVERFGGRIDKHNGDNVMGLFGAPIAHDNDPERAARAALEIHVGMQALSERRSRRLTAHIGIAAGEVVASDMGSQSHSAYTVVGDSVNLAARLEGAAGPGETVISESVYRAIAGQVECSERGAVQLKGFPAPAKIWRLEGFAGGQSPQSETLFVGRRAELGQFQSLLETCTDEGVGQVVLVRGEAGIGKTRLTAEFTQMAQAKDFALYKALVLDFGVGKGQDAVRTLVRRLLGVPEGAGKEVRMARARTAFADGDFDDSQWVFFYDLLDLPPPSEALGLYEAMDNATRNAGKRALVSQLVRVAARAGPALIVIEDLHWADSMVLAHVIEIVNVIADLAVMMILTTRPEGDPFDRSLKAEIRATPLVTLDLRALRDQDAQKLVESFITSDSPFARRCVERAAGNPLFLEQLLRNADEELESSLPASIQSLVQSRMDRLQPGDRAALQAAAVIGQRFTLDDLRAVVDDPGYDPGPLVAQNLIRPNDDGYLFAHALVLEGVMASLLKASLRRLHGRAADWFADQDPILEAQHRDRAGDPAAAPAYLRAARAQRALYRTERARELLTRGAELAGDAEQHVEILLALGEAQLDLGEVEAAIESNRSALEQATQGHERCAAQLGIAAGLRMSDNYTDALGHLAEAQQEAEANSDAGQLARIHHMRGNIYFPLGDSAGCGAEHEQALIYARQAGSRELEARALNGLGDAAYAAGRMLSAGHHFQASLDLARAEGFRSIEVSSLYMLAAIKIYHNALEEAAGLGHEAVEAERGTGNLRAEILALQTQALPEAMMGRSDEAEKAIERSSRIVRRIGVRRFESEDGIILSLLEMIAGNGEAAIRQSEQAVAVALETGVSYVGPWIMGQLAAFTNDPKQREEMVRRSEEVLDAGSVGHNYLWFYRWAIDAFARAGDWDRVESYARHLQDFVAEEPLPWSDFHVAKGRALAAYGRGGRAAEILHAVARLRAQAEDFGDRFSVQVIDEVLAQSMKRPGNED